MLFLQQDNPVPVLVAFFLELVAKSSLVILYAWDDDVIDTCVQYCMYE
jgi:hypothetical protein